VAALSGAFFSARSSRGARAASSSITSSTQRLAARHVGKPLVIARRERSWRFARGTGRNRLSAPGGAGLVSHTTSVQDSVAGTHMVDQIAAAHPTIRKVWVDGGHRQHLVEHAAHLGIDMEIVQPTPGARGFTPLPKRWTVERTFGWLMFHRRLARDYETLPARSEAMIHLAMTDLMAGRLTGEATISWRNPTSRDQTPIPG
jgi:transposase